MKKLTLTPVLLAVAAFVAACSSMPTTTGLLDQTRSDFAVAQNNPDVSRYAPLELKQASEALDKANAAAADSDSLQRIDQLAYVAKQKIALTQEVTKRKLAEADIATAGKDREQVRLDQRTSEANQAKASAEQAKLTARIAESEAADAQRRTQEAQRETREAQSEAAQARGKTEEAQANAAKLEAQLTELAAKKTERGMVITLGDVLFGVDQARLNPQGMRTAQQLADVLQQNPQRTVLIEGFTDSTGASLYNQELSERRAGAVRNSLQELGVARERVAIRGYGESYPVASNDSAQSRQLNRRVEIVLSDASGKVMQR